MAKFRDRLDWMVIGAVSIILVALAVCLVTGTIDIQHAGSMLSGAAGR